MCLETEIASLEILRNHPYICHLYEWFWIDKTFYMCMELIEGEMMLNAIMKVCV